MGDYARQVGGDLLAPHESEACKDVIRKQVQCGGVVGPGEGI